MNICDLADYILYYSKKRLSNLELQNYIYYLNESHRIKCNEKLIDDPFELWTLGVVNREIYFKYRHYGASDIDRPKNVIQVDENLKSFLLDKIEEADTAGYYVVRRDAITHYKEKHNLKSEEDIFACF